LPDGDLNIAAQNLPPLGRQPLIALVSEPIAASAPTPRNRHASNRRSPGNARKAHAAQCAMRWTSSRDDARNNLVGCNAAIGDADDALRLWAKASSWVMMTSVDPVCSRRDRIRSMIARLSPRPDCLSVHRRTARQGEGPKRGRWPRAAARRPKAGWVMVQAVAKADGGQFLGGAGGGIGNSGQFERGHHIFLCRHRGQQMKRLKHHPDPPAPGQRQLILGQSHEIGARDR
jgi:hypothetical protein